jgi:pyruvate/2-oxoglutarate/acetoin dehydrogenase E1 component
MLYLESLNRALHDLMQHDPEVVLLGEDLHDPYGGAFKVSRGLSTAFPAQVISTPISEQAIIGAAIGMALRGMKPIAEIMFGDFMTLGVDQIVNHATKYHWMFNEQVNVPVVIRTPMGGGRGYGPTHSQSLESLFLSVPGLTMCAPSVFHDPGALLTHHVRYSNHPVLFVENKAAYPKKLYADRDEKPLHCISREDTVIASLYPDEPADVVVITYGGMAEVAAEVATSVFLEEEILVQVVVLATIKPLNLEPVLPLVRHAGKVVVLEEGPTTGGWGAEVAAMLHQSVHHDLQQPIARLGAKDMPIPSALPLEQTVLPTPEKLLAVIREMM